MNELLGMKRREETQFKQSGNKRWREDAEHNYWLRVDELNQELALEAEMKRTVEVMVQPYPAMDAEENNKVVDDVFGFLNDPTSPEPVPKRKTAVSKMLKYFEEKSRNKKIIPTKLLSRPVNFYESSRL